MINGRCVGVETQGRRRLTQRQCSAIEACIFSDHDQVFPFHNPLIMTEKN